MRRLAGLLVLTLLLVVPAVTAVGQAADYADEFSGASYSGNDGTLEFAGPWHEFGDDDSPGSGKLYVGGGECPDGNCLHMEGEGLVLQQFGVKRSADTSVFNSFHLKYDIHVDGSQFDEAQLIVEVWDGSQWVSVQMYSLSESIDGVRRENFLLSGYRCQAFEVRFRVPRLFEGDVAYFTGAVAIDNVDITGSLAPATATCTTTSSTTTTTTPTTTSAPTTTSTSTTTTTTSPTTTTTSPTTTTTEPTTTSTEPHRTTTTTRAPTTTSTLVTTTSSNPTSTTTTLAAIVAGEDTPPDPPEFEAGIHDMGEGKGLMYDIHEGMNGDLSGLDDVEVLSAAVTADFSLAVEAFKSTKVWLAALSLMIAAALVSGMDHRRRVRGEFATLSAGQPVVEG
jgi:hypothetical protein